MYMCTYNFGNAPCKKVPNDNSAIIAANSQKCTPAIEGAGKRHTDAIKGAICLLVLNVNKSCKDTEKGLVKLQSNESSRIWRLKSI